MAGSSPILLGISRCLLGDPVRYDGGHKYNDYLVNGLGRQVQWVPVCPEVEAGLGTPREPMQLVRRTKTPRLVTIESRRDVTVTLRRFSAFKLYELQRLDLSGYVFKARSPSCGVDDVPLHDRQGKAQRTGAGLFARAFQKHFPLIPIADEGRLARPLFRRHFLEQVSGYQRWKQFSKRPVTQRSLERFHRAQAMLLCSRSPRQYDALNRLVARAAEYSAEELAARYGRAFMRVLRSPARSTGTRRRKGIECTVT